MKHLTHIDLENMLIYYGILTGMELSLSKNKTSWASKHKKDIPVFKKSHTNTTKLTVHLYKEGSKIGTNGKNSLH